MHALCRTAFQPSRKNFVPPNFSYKPRMWNNSNGMRDQVPPPTDRRPRWGIGSWSISLWKERSSQLHSMASRSPRKTTNSRMVAGNERRWNSPDAIVWILHSDNPRELWSRICRKMKQSTVQSRTRSKSARSILRWNHSRSVFACIARSSKRNVPGTTFLTSQGWKDLELLVGTIRKLEFAGLRFVASKSLCPFAAQMQQIPAAQAQWRWSSLWSIDAKNTSGRSEQLVVEWKNLRVQIPAMG